MAKESLAVLLKELYFGAAPELELEIIDRALPWIKGRVKWVRVCFEVVAKSFVITTSTTAL